MLLLILKSTKATKILHSVKANLNNSKKLLLVELWV